MIKNYMEILVSSLFNEIIANYDICECENCIYDVKTIALNDLPPMYFLASAKESEKTTFLLNRQKRISVLAKVISALEIVKQNEHNVLHQKNSKKNTN